MKPVEKKSSATTLNDCRGGISHPKKRLQRRKSFLLVFSYPDCTLRENTQPSMAKATTTLDWCIVRLGDDHNWWISETSDPVRWDVDGLSIIDPRQVDHLIEVVEPLRDYGFDQDLFESAFVLFRIDKEEKKGSVRLKRVKDSIFDSDDKLFALADTLDEENGPYADLLDHLTRCRVKMLNDLIEFESKLTVDEVEDELREAQNADFIEGNAVHTFNELNSILDYVPEGYETDEDNDDKDPDDEDNEDIPDLDAEEEEKLKNDQSLKWDGDDDEDEDEDSDDSKSEDSKKGTERRSKKRS